MNVVDVCVAATSNAIKHNLYIFENLGGQAVIIQQLCREETTDGIKKKNETKKQKTTKNVITSEYESEEEDKEAKKKQSKEKKQKRRKNPVTSEDDSEEEQANKKRNKAKKPRRKVAKKNDSSDKDDGSGVIELFDKEYPCVAKNDKKIKIGQNPPQRVFINNQITRCSRCKVEFTANERKKLQDLIFKYKIFRSYPIGNGKMRTNKYQSPAYFPAKDLGCLVCIEELKEREFAVTDCYISNATMHALQKGHISALRRHKLWDGLLK